MIDPMTTEQLAKFTVNEWLKRAEQDRLAAEITKAHGSLLSRAVTSVLRWIRRDRNVPRQEPIRYSPVTRRS
jgi:hypothetical protein